MRWTGSPDGDRSRGLRLDFRLLLAEGVELSVTITAKGAGPS